MAKKRTPTPMSSESIGRVRMEAVRLRGCSSITLREGGKEARAIAPKVSMIRFTHSICVTVSGDSLPMKEPKSTRKQAATLTVSWKRRKRCMFL